MSNYDLTCLVPVLEAGAEIPGFRFRTRNIGPCGQIVGSNMFPVWESCGRFEWFHDAPPEAYFAAVGWLVVNTQSVMTEQQQFEVMRTGVRYIEALCAAWLKENTK